MVNIKHPEYIKSSYRVAGGIPELWYPETVKLIDVVKICQVYVCTPGEEYDQFVLRINGKFYY